MKNTTYISIFYTFLLLIVSCSDKPSQKFSLNKFNSVKIIKFNKKKVKFETSFNFLNNSDKEIIITQSDFDIFINEIDVSSQINQSIIAVASKKNYEIPIKVEFEPKKVFSNYQTGITKIKSNIIATVKIIGTIQTEIDSKKVTLEYSDEQEVLFTNDTKLKLNNEGKIIHKE